MTHADAEGFFGQQRGGAFVKRNAATCVKRLGGNNVCVEREMALTRGTDIADDRLQQLRLRAARDHVVFDAQVRFL